MWITRGNIRLRCGHLRDSKPGKKFATLPFRMKQYQELSDIFPLSDDESGSGSDVSVEAEPASGSGFGDSDGLSKAKPPTFLQGLQHGKLKQKLTEEDLLL